MFGSVGGGESENTRAGEKQAPGIFGEKAELRKEKDTKIPSQRN